MQVDGSTTSSRTATAANALEVDMPTCHQRDRELAAVGDGHSAIVPRMPRAVTTRVDFSSQ